MEKNLTTGSVLKSILYFSLPYLLSYFLQTLYGMADLFIIGQFEDISSITAVSIGSQVMHMITVMIVGLAMGATVNIGQAIGAGNKKKAAKDIGNTVTLFMMLAIVGAVGLLFFIKPIVGRCQHRRKQFMKQLFILPSVLWEFLLLLPIILSVLFLEE